MKKEKLKDIAEGFLEILFELIFSIIAMVIGILAVEGLGLDFASLDPDLLMLTGVVLLGITAIPLHFLMRYMKNKFRKGKNNKFEKIYDESSEEELFE